MLVAVDSGVSADSQFKRKVRRYSVLDSDIPARLTPPTLSTQGLFLVMRQLVLLMDAENLSFC